MPSSNWLGRDHSAGSHDEPPLSLAALIIASWTVPIPPLPQRSLEAIQCSSLNSPIFPSIIKTFRSERCTAGGGCPAYTVVDPQSCCQAPRAFDSSTPLDELPGSR